MTTAQSTPAVEGDSAAEAHAFANALRSLADVIDSGELHPTNSVQVFCTRFGFDGRETFLAARRAFPAAPVVVDGALREHYVQIEVGKGVRLLFDKNALGTRTTVTRDVTEYVIDPELLAPVATS